MSELTLIRASELANAFHEAVDSACKSDPVLQRKVAAAFRQPEILQLQQYQASQMKMTAGLIPEGRERTQFMETCVRNAEMMAGILMRVMPPGQAVRYIPAQYRTEIDADILHARRAQKVAVLCTYGIA